MLSAFEYIVIAGLFCALAGLIASIPISVRQNNIRKGRARGLPGRRYAVTFKSNSPQALAERISDYLLNKRFVSQTYGAENVFRTGDGFWTVMKMIKFYTVENGVYLEAFIISGFRTVERGCGRNNAEPVKPLTKILAEIARITI